MDTNNNVCDYGSDRLRLRMLMDSESLNQSQFAERIGIKQSNLSEILSGKRPIGPNIINKLIISFGINPTWIMTGIGEVYTNNISKNTKIHDDNLWQRIEELAIKLFSPDNDKTAFGIDYEKMEAKTGISAPRLYNIIRDSEYPTYTEIQNILNSKSININAEWFMTGKGFMLKSEQPTPIVSYSTGRPYYNVDFIGGFDLVLNDQTINPEYNIDFAPYNKEGVLWCNVTGHSMEPEIHHGDTMAIKKMNESNIDYLPFGEVYAIVTDEYRTVKRISKAEKDGFIKLIPSNPSPEYTAQDIPQAMIRAIYQVLVSVKRF